MKNRGYAETKSWIDSGREGPAPQPPDGLHEIAATEWWIGYEMAHEEEANEDETIDFWASVIMWLIKIACIIGVIVLAVKAGDGYQVVGGVIGLVMLFGWRTK